MHINPTELKAFKLRWRNFSGDWFEDMYTEHEANVLFENKMMTSTEIELIPPTGQWYVVWNRNLGKCFECWKN